MLQLCLRQTAALRSNYLMLNQFIQTPRHRCWRRSPGIQTVTFRTHPGQPLGSDGPCPASSSRSSWRVNRCSEFSTFGALSCEGCYLLIYFFRLKPSRAYFIA